MSEDVRALVGCRPETRGKLAGVFVLGVKLQEEN